MSIKAEVLWDVIPCNLADWYARTEFHGGHIPTDCNLHNELTSWQ